MKILIGVEGLSHIIDDSTTPPTKLEPLTGTATAAEVAMFNTASEEYWEFKHSDAVVKHLIVSTISDYLLLKNIRHTTASSLWEAICVEHE